MLERFLGRPNYNHERKEALISQLLVLFTHLPEVENYLDDRVAYMVVNKKFLKNLSHNDWQFLLLENNQPGLVPKVSICQEIKDAGEAVWLAVGLGQRRVRYCHQEGKLVVFYELEVSPGEWLFLDESQTSWLVLEKLIRAIESRTSASEEDRLPGPVV